MSRTITTVADGLIEYLQEQGIVDELPKLIARLQLEVDRQHEITVISAETLSKADCHQITLQTKQTWGEHPISFFVDPLLVTGILVRFRDQLLDLSTRNRLSELKEYLA